MLHRRLARLLAALPCAAALAAPGLTPSTAGAVASPSPTWTRTVSGSPANTGIDQPYSSPAVGDLFGNGRREVVAGFPDGTVRAWYSDGTPVSGWPVQTGGEVDASPTLAPLSGDGRLQVIVPSRSGWVFVYNPDGSPYGHGWPQHALFAKPWANTDFVPDFFASAAVGSLFGDGTLDVVATSWDHRLYAWDASAHMLAGFPINLWDTVWDTPVLVDLEGRGQRDIVVGSDSNGGVEPNPKGGVWWAFRPDGSLIWKRLQDEVPWSSPAAAIMNPGDVQPSIVGGTGHYFAQTMNPTVGRYDNVFTASGGDRFGHPLFTQSQNFSSPAVGDLLNRGDGSREIVQISEHVPNGPPATVYAWDGNGSLLPGWPVSPTNGTELGSPIIAPVGGACGSGNGVWIPGWYHVLGYCSNGTLAADIATGSAAHPSPMTAAPTVADLGNGHLSLVAMYQTDLSNTSWAVSTWPLAGTTGMPGGAWPTFHGSAERAGTEAILPDPANRTFVKNLYHDVLGRTSAPAQAEVDFWAGRLDNGAFRSWVASALVGSSEAHGHVVDADYAGILHRAPDAGGRAYWVGQLDAGAYNENLLGLLGGSDEYFAQHGNDARSLVLALYHDVLHRPAAPPEQDVQYWLSRLRGGMPRAVIGQVFAASHEYHLQLVDSWYLQYLFRHADPRGDEFWATFLDQGHRDDVTIVQLTASAEYFGHISSF